MLCILLATMLTGCNDIQSAMHVFGAEARQVRTITIILTVGATLLFATVAAIYVRAVRAPEEALSHEAGMRMVLWVGAVGPAIILGILLIYALPAMRPRVAQPGDMVIRVDGEQFWWRIDYRAPGQPPMISANEVRVPVGRTVAFELTASDVIHSFWIPGLAGKMDMIPGRANRLVVRPEKAGRYRGVCAEFCGLSHALMAFEVIAMPPDDFDRWLATSRGASRTALADSTERGRALFDAQGCGACHAIRGTAHDATIGPDLSRFGERSTLGAGILPPTPANVAAFIRRPQDHKPGARMPAYPQLSDADTRAIADYLKALR